MTDYNAIAESNNFIVLDQYIKAPQSESYQSESDLERELIQDLIQQGYQYLPKLTNPQAMLPTCASSCKRSIRCSLPKANGGAS
ncbi:hypothetical protein NC980_14755 [Leptolyngbya sp. AS-A5]|nr:hypothetical protein [Leptolyngbya sp. FACHB-17]